MILKHISECQPDGNIKTSALLVEKSGSVVNQDAENIICNLGSLQNEGLDSLIELSNSINKFLLESTLDFNRDGLESSHSYGTVYLISQIFRDNGITSEHIFGSDNKAENEQRFDYLISLVACLLDNQSNADSNLNSLQKKIYFKKDVKLDPASILTLIDSIRQYPDLQYNSSNCLSQFSDKLTAWLSTDTESWSVFNDFDGILFIAELAEFVRFEVEELSSLSWSSISDNLTELHAVRFERGAETLLLTTRPTSSHLKLFYRLDIELPAQVILESRKQFVKDQNENVKISKFEFESSAVLN